MTVTLIFYGALALLAFAATFHDRDLRPIGFFLAFSFIVSNLLWFSASIQARPGLYTMTELLIAVTVYAAIMEEKSWALVAVLGCNVVSVCANIGLASFSAPTMRQIYLHEVTTNICFVAECLLITWAGVADAVRTGRFRWWPSGRRGAVQSRRSSRDDA